MISKNRQGAFLQVTVTLLFLLSTLLGACTPKMDRTPAPPTSGAIVQDAIHTPPTISSGTAVVEVQAEASPSPSEPVVTSQTQPSTPHAESEETQEGWPMVAANPARTSWTPHAVPGQLEPVWFTPFDAYISQKVQIIAALNTLFISASDGLHALDAASGQERWFYPTALPLGHSPTIHNGVAYVGGFDKMIHAIDASSGNPLWTFAASAGFETNPLIAEGKLFAGNRDGFFYALDASTGELAWKFQVGAPILFSAAYQDGLLFFAANDNHAYALRAADGQLAWKSPKLPGHGFHSYWPVIFGDYVVFSGAYNYRYNEPFPGAHTQLERQQAFPPGLSKGDPIGPLGNEPGNWMPGTKTIHNTPAAQYFEQFPHRRTTFVFHRGSGEEFSFDADQDGLPEFAPFLWLGTHSGTRYPPMVGPDQVLYQANSLYYDPWIPRGKISGWKFGTPFVSAPNASGNASDEPVAYSVGGNIVYWKRCCDRLAGAFEIFRASGSAADLKSWIYYDDGARSLRRTLPGLFDRGWPYAYWKHGDQSPPIPYQGKVYLLANNAVVAFAPNGLDPVLPNNQDRGTFSGEKPEDIERGQTFPALNTKVTLDTTAWPLIISQESYYSTDTRSRARARWFRLVEVTPGENEQPHGLEVEEGEIGILLTSRIDSSQAFKTWVSRRSPTTLFDNDSPTYTLRAGLSAIAFPSPTGVQIRSGTASFFGSELSAGWLLAWDSSNNHRWNPLVISLEQRPTQVSLSPSGLLLSFPTRAGYLAITPLYGMRSPRSSEATQWSGGIPQETLQRVNLIDRLARAFPDSATESWTIDRDSGDVRLSYNYHFITFPGEWGAIPLRLVPLPPQLALAAWNGSPVRVNDKELGEQFDLEYVTPLGRVAGVLDSDGVTALLPGLARYWRDDLLEKVEVQEDDPLREKLVAEVDKMLTAGHLLPGYGVVGIWETKANHRIGDMLNDYWKNPADTIYTLLRALPLLPEEMRSGVRDYLRKEFEKYPLDQVAHIGWREGANREWFDLPPEVVEQGAKSPPGWRNDFNRWKLPPQNLYALWMYAREFGEAEALFERARQVLDETPQFEASLPYVLNSYIAGYLGYLRLAGLAGAGRQEKAERTLIDLLVKRAALSKYPEALAQAGFEYGGYAWALRKFTPGESDTLFSPAIIGSVWSQLPLYGFPIDRSYGLSGATNGGDYAFAIDFVNLTSELALFLDEYARRESAAMIEDYSQRAPYWFVGKAEEAGGEGVFQPPYDRWAYFQARALVLQASRTELEPYLDVSMTRVGDLYYIQNLTSTLRKPAGFQQPVPAPTPTPQPPVSGKPLRINFQPPASTTPEGFLPDDGSAFGDRGNGYQYGWNKDNRSHARLRNAPNQSNPALDTLNHMQLDGEFIWEIALPDGVYHVRLVAGDPSYFDSVYKIQVEDVLVIDATPSEINRYTSGASVVTVQDGRLSIHNAPGAQNNKVNFLEVIPLSPWPFKTK